MAKKRHKQLQIQVDPAVWDLFGATHRQKRAHLQALADRPDLAEIVAEGRALTLRRRVGELALSKCLTAPDAIQRFGEIGLSRFETAGLVAGMAITAVVTHARQRCSRVSTGAPVDVRKFVQDVLSDFPSTLEGGGVSDELAVDFGTVIGNQLVLRRRTFSWIWQVTAEASGKPSFLAPHVVSIDLWPDLSLRALRYDSGQGPAVVYAPIYENFDLETRSAVDRARELIRSSE